MMHFACPRELQLLSTVFFMLTNLLTYIQLCVWRPIKQLLFLVLHLTINEQRTIGNDFK